MRTFREAGYILLASPRSDVMPLDLLFKSGNGTIERMNSKLYELFLPKSKAWPVTKKNKTLSTDMTSEEVLDFSVDADVSLLKALIKLLPVSASTELSYRNKKKSVVHLIDAKSDDVGQLALDEYLQSSTLNRDAKDTISKMKNGQLYVITETVKTKSYTVKDENSNKTEFEVKGSAKEIAEAGVDVERTKTTNSGMRYNGESYLVFCVKASRIKYDQSWLFSNDITFRLKKDDNIILVLGDEEFPSEPLDAENGIINL